MIVGLATRWVAVVLVFGSFVAPMMNAGFTTDRLRHHGVSR